jgi:hypothetical protein
MALADAIRERAAEPLAHRRAVSARTIAAAKALGVEKGLPQPAINELSATTFVFPD